jgi:hypothetical protein
MPWLLQGHRFYLSAVGSSKAMDTDGITHDPLRVHYCWNTYFCYRTGMILSGKYLMHADWNQLYCILHNKFVQKQFQIIWYPQLLDVRQYISE